PTNAGPPRQCRRRRLRRRLADDLVESGLGGTAGRPVVRSAPATQLRQEHLPRQRVVATATAMARDLARPRGQGGRGRLRPAPRDGPLSAQRRLVALVEELKQGNE